MTRNRNPPHLGSFDFLVAKAFLRTKVKLPVKKKKKKENVNQVLTNPQLVLFALT